MRSRTRPETALLSAGLLTVAAVVGASLPAAAEPEEDWLDAPTPPAVPPVPSADQRDRSVTVWSINGVTVWEINGVSTLETTEEEPGETTISLAADILFEPDAWDVPGPARDRITELVAEIPEGGAVEVSGHTDSVQGGSTTRSCRRTARRPSLT